MKGCGIMLHGIEHATKSFRLMLTHGLWKELVAQIRQKGFSTHVYVDAVLDVGTFAGPGRFRVPLVAHPVAGPEEPTLSAVLADRSMPSHERHEASRRLTMLATGVRTCYAIADAGGIVRVVQWLILPDQNGAVRRIYGDWYPSLAADEALMENAYVFPKYRGTGVLSSAVESLVEIARAAGVTRIHTSIPVTNTNSFMSFARMGFVPRRIRVERRRFGVPVREVLPVSSCTDLRSFAQFAASLPGHRGPVPATVAF